MNQTKKRSLSDFTVSTPQNRPSFTFNLLQPISQTIGRPKGAKSGFFRARLMPIPAKQGLYRGFRKTIVSVFRE
jgi:hypothetical protein